MAEYYDCNDDSEELHCTSEEEAVEQWLEGWREPGDNIVALIAAHTPVTVHGYDPEGFDVEREAKSMAQTFVEQAIEHFDSEWGNPDGDTEVKEGVEEKVQEAIRAAMVELFGSMTVWRCAVVSKRVLDAPTVEAMMREHRPDWFEDAEKSE